MEVKLDKRYEMGVAPEHVWTVLSQVTEVAGCMPGAALGEQTGDNAYKGTVKVKVGPATANFGGDIEVLSLEPENRRMVMMGKGADKGGSSASMELEAIVEAVEGNPNDAVLVGNANVIVNGKFAQFGGRMMVQVSDIILAQFADNFRAKAQAVAAASAPAAGGGASAEAAPAAAASPAPAVDNSLNGLALVWMLIKNWFGSLFGKKASDH